MTTTLTKTTIVLAGAVLLAGLGLGTEAQARVKGPVFDSFSAGCLSLQTESDGLVAEYKNASEARREEILAKLRNIGQTWIDIGCKAVFGDISLMVLTPHGLRNGITKDMLVAPPADPAPDHPQPETAPAGKTGGDGIFLY
jgi:hypothetical protein